MYFNKLKFLTAAALLSAAFVSTVAFAQPAPSVTLSSGSGQPGDTVAIDFAFVGDGIVGAGLQFVMSDETAFSNIDLTNCLAGNDARVPSCVIPGSSPDTVRITLANTSTTPLGDFTGTILFEIDAAATAPQTIDLVWDEAFTNTTPTDATVTHNNGSIEITEGPPPPESELSLTPAAMTFGTVDLGSMPVTDTFTLENIGAADADITSVTLAGPDAEFTIAADNCSGPLAAGASCTVDIQFNAAANGSYSNQLDIASNANVNPNPSAAITGSADSAPTLSATPRFGAWNLGNGQSGDTLTSNGSVSNSGSAPGDFSCTLSGDSVFSVSPSPLGGTVMAGESLDFSVSCALPRESLDGDSYSGTLACTGDVDGTYELSCAVTAFQAVPVPTMSKWGLAVLTLLMLMVGGLTVRFFRA